MITHFENCVSKLSDIQIRAWVKADERFEQRSDGDCLYLSYRDTFTAPKWLFRYRFGGKQRVMNLGSYTVLSLADARKTAKELSARVSLGYDVAGEKQERKNEAAAKIDAVSSAWTVAKLADEYFERNILERWKHPHIVRSRIENNIKPAIGKMKAEDVRPLADPRGDYPAISGDARQDRYFHHRKRPRSTLAAVAGRPQRGADRGAVGSV